MRTRKNERNITLPKAITIVACAIALAGCSSAPKRPAEIFTNRNAAIGQLDLGNQSVSKGDYTNAHLFLGEAWRLALSTDDPSTRIRVLLAEGSAYFSEGKRDKADEIWATAQSEAESIQDKTLIGITKIYRARGTLAEGLPSGDVTEADRKARAEKVKAIAFAEIDNVKENNLYEALAWKVVGLSEKELGDSKAAVSAIEKAASIHEKGRYLEDAAYDWYLIASVHSKTGNYAEARKNLAMALSFDRRAENANGIGMDWLALGTIEEKTGNKEGAISNYTRAGDIFRSAFLTSSAAEADRKRDALKNAGTDSTPPANTQ